MVNYNSNRTGQAHDNDENRLTTLENDVVTLENDVVTLENDIVTLNNNLHDNYLPFSGGTMTGPITVAAMNGIIFPATAGYATNQYGNFIHKQDVTTDYWHLDSYNETPAFRCYWETGECRATTWTTTSKREYKTNILEYKGNAINLINTIKICSFNYKDDPNTNKIGFIADDTHEIFAGKNHDVMDINNCIGMLLKAVQELSAENEELKQRISKLEQVINNGSYI